MRSKKRIVTAAVGLCLTLPGIISAQENSINAYSPYTFYGLGDIAVLGTANLRSMGGAGVAYRNSSQINYLNPAAASAVNRQSFLFNIEGEGQNYYLRSESTRSSFNSFNLRDVAIQMPLHYGIGLGVSVTPLSNVGYRVEQYLSDIEIEGNLGQVLQKYSGEGGVTQAKLGVGARLLPYLSLGAEMVYYHGSINRYYSQVVTPITGTGQYVASEYSRKERISRIFANFGVQVDAIASTKRVLTFGATFQPGGDLRAREETYIPSGNLYGDTVRLEEVLSDFSMASTLGLGMFYHTPKLSVGLDYTFQDWGRRNRQDQTDEVRFVNTHSVKFGGQYTPDRGNIRSALKRWSYRAGVRYSSYYMEMRGQKIDEKAVTLGFGIPLRMNSMSNLNVGFEYGRRGTIRHGLIREDYFKISLGLSLFDFDWFKKQKIN